MYSYDRIASLQRLPPRLTLIDARRKKTQLHASLGSVELKILRLLATKAGSFWGKPGDPEVLLTERIVQQKPDRAGRIRTKVEENSTHQRWGATISMMTKAGWLRFASYSLPGDAPFGQWFLTAGAETALQAMGEGKPPLIDFHVE